MRQRWYPTSDISPMWDTMNRFFEESFARPGFGAGALPLNVYERDDALIVEALLPGTTPEDVDVSVDRGVLRIAARRQGPATADDQQATWHAREIWTGQARRSLTLPFEVDVEQARADYRHGLLTLTLPKAVSARPTRIQLGATPARQLEAAGGAR